MTGGLKEKHKEAIIAEIEKNIRVERAVLFGSRAMGTNTITSDVDIALYGDSLTLIDQAKLSATLKLIPMAQSVDLVLFNKIDYLPLIQHIQKYGIEWYRSPANTDKRNCRE